MTRNPFDIGPHIWSYGEEPAEQVSIIDPVMHVAHIAGRKERDEQALARIDAKMLPLKLHEERRAQLFGEFLDEIARGRTAA